jgi:hypothetical protein
MKKLLSTALLLSISSITRPMQDEKLCKMPSEEVLKTAICSPDMRYFCAKVPSLCKELADQEMHPLGVVNNLEMAFIDYEDNIHKGSSGYAPEQLQRQRRSVNMDMALMHLRKEEIVRNIFKVSSCNCDAMQVLVDAGIFKQKQN